MWDFIWKGGVHVRKLELIFENAEGKNVTYSLDQPVEPVDIEAVEAAMEEVIAQDVFSSNGGNIVAKKAARIVERTVEDIEIELE